nr:hypothetical protein [Tanacetum cinerariifolium]
MIELRGTFQAWLQLRKDQVCQKIPLCYNDDDDDEESSTPLKDIIIFELLLCIAITPVFSTKEPKDSLIMGDEYLDTILEKESDEFIKSSVENLILNPSEFEDECECDVPACDDFTTFSNLLFYADDDFSSSVNESFSDEGISKEIYSNPLFDEEIISIKIDPHYLNAESDLIESFLNQDSSIISFFKIDSLLDEFAGKLILLKSIPPGIDEADCDPEKEIRLIEKSCGDSLEDIFCHQCTCELCGKGAHYGYNCPPKVLVISNLEPCHNQNVDELPQTLPSFDPTCYSRDENSFTYDSQFKTVDDSPNEEEKRIEEEQAAKARYWKIPVCYDDDDNKDYTIAITPILSIEEPDNSLSMRDKHLDTVPTTESDEFIKSSVENLVPILSESEGILDNMCDVPFHDNSPPLDILKDQFEDFFDSNDDSTSIDDDSFSIDNIKYVEASPPDFELVSLEDFFDSNDDSTSIDDDSFSIDNIKYVEASPPDSELVSLEVMEIVIPEVGGIDDDILLTIKDDILREKLLNINLLIANIEALKDNPTPSSNFMTKSSSTSFNFLLEETNTFDNSLPESKAFYFDLEEISSGSTTTRSNISLPDYEAFYDDHVKEISSSSTTTHSDYSLYDSFIFDLSINPFPPADRSDFYHEDFVDELAHIVSPPEYDCFCFKNEPNAWDFTMDVVEDIFPTREPKVYNALPTHPTLQLNMDFILSSESLFAFVVWIFLLFLSYSVAPQYLLSFGNKDTIFNPGISSYHIYSFMPDVSHRSETFMKFNVYLKMLNESLMEILFSTCSPMDQ